MKKELEKKNIMEARKRFQKLYEYSFYESNINEADDEEGAEEDPMAGGTEGGADPMMGGGDPMTGGTEGGADPMMGGGDPMTGGVEGGADPMAGGAEGGAEGGVSDPMAGMEGQLEGGMDAEMGADPMAGGEDEEVIDVDDLTNAQEKTYDEMGDLSKKFDKLLNVIDKFEEVIAMNDEKIDALEANIKAELEKRNPTAIEKLNLRSQNDSQPFNVSPTDFWKEKEATSNYRIGDDMEDEAPQYKIMQGDIDEVGDWRSISQSLDTGDFNQTLKQILNF